jgi:hypothetical protein
MSTDPRNEVSTPSQNDFEFSLFTTSGRACSSKQAELNVHIKYTGQKAKSGMIIVFVRLPSGWQSVENSIQLLTSDRRVDLKRYEIAENKVNFYFEDLERNVSRAFRFQAESAFHVTNIKPGLLSVYDYYEPMDDALTQQFEIVDCNQI